MNIIGNKYTKLLFILLVIACMIFIFCMSAEIASESDDTSGFFVELLSKVLGKDETDDFITFVRKLAHMFEFAMLGLCSYMLVCHYDIKTKIRFVFVFVFCLVYAASDELHQYFVPGRACRFTDVCIDAFGSFIGILFAFIIFYLIIKRRKK